MLLIHINWDSIGYMYLFSKQIQSEGLCSLGREVYIKLPKQGTNPRGVELSSEAINYLINHKETEKIPIEFIRSQIDYNQYARWLDYWQQD
jgi:hypothetical protein